MIKVIHGIRDNDAKGELGGTQYYTLVEDPVLGSKRYEYNIWDIINNTPLYKQINKDLIEIESLNKAIILERELKYEETQKQLKLSQAKYTFNKSQLDIIQGIVSSIDKSKLTDKLINSLVGKCLKEMKTVPPLAIKNYILELLK